MGKALVLNREYASEDPQNAYGLINYSLTALAALAYDRGWRTIQSHGYMPGWMIKGEI